MKWNLFIYTPKNIAQHPSNNSDMKNPKHVENCCFLKDHLGLVHFLRVAMSIPANVQFSKSLDVVN